VAHRRQIDHGPDQEGDAAVAAQKKTGQALLQELERIIESTRPAFKQDRSLGRARIRALSQLVCLGRHTVTGTICASGRQFQDWSADYKLCSKQRFDRDRIYAAIRREAAGHLREDDDVVCAMDDSLMRKKGTKIPGAGRLRDPLSPPFRINLAWGLRFVQTSMIAPPQDKDGPGRAIPVDFVNAPVPKKPRTNSPPAAWNEYYKQKEETNISRVGAARIQKLRSELDFDEKTRGRRLVMAVDNRFTNGKVFRDIPERTVLVGRLRHDACLYHLPEAEKQPRGRGRKKSYGERAASPEQIRKDDSIPWRRVPMFAAGRRHEFKVKKVSPLLWKPAGADKPLSLVIIAPLAYRPSKKSKVLYRKPAYLVCTDPGVPLDKIVQAYVWRWEIEVNFREEKQLAGLGEAQVRNENSVENDPAFTAAVYAMLLLAGLAAGKDKMNSLSPPKWRKKEKPRVSTQDLINQLRTELWGKAMGHELGDQDNFNGFRDKPHRIENFKKLQPQLKSSVLYATG
jgi:hypothetical protein